MLGSGESKCPQVLTKRRTCVICEVCIHPPRDRKRDNWLFHRSFNHATFLLEELSFTLGPCPSNFSLILVIHGNWNSSKSYLAKLKVLQLGSPIHLHKEHCLVKHHHRERLTKNKRWAQCRAKLREKNSVFHRREEAWVQRAGRKKQRNWVSSCQGIPVWRTTWKATLGK